MDSTPELTGQITRRQVLTAGVATALGATAGCVGVGGDTAEPDLTNTPTGILRQYYHAAARAESQAAFLARATELVHTVSSFDRILETEPQYWTDPHRSTVEQITVVEEDISDERVVERVGFLGPSVLPLYGTGRAEDLDAIAGRNAVTRATLVSHPGDRNENENESGNDGENGNDDEDGATRREREWLLATDDDQWRIVWE